MQQQQKQAQLSEDVQFLHSSVFKQVQGCGDIIGSILLICKFVSENSIIVHFDVSKLRQIALRSMDKETSTYLWHVNALIAASADFEHLILGIEMMFERFLGSSQLFLKEKAKLKAKAQTDARDTKFLGNEIVSFVNSYYEETESTNDSPAANHEKETIANQEKQEKQEKICIGATENIMKTPIRARHKNAIDGLEKGMKGLTTAIQCEWLNDENENRNANVNVNMTASPMLNHPSTDTSKAMAMAKGGDALNEYRGKISSPISFRMRQQKRMMQSERGSRAPSASTSFMSYGAFEQAQAQSKAMGSVAVSVDASLLDDMHLMETQSRVSLEPEAASPFDVNKFAQSVDMYSSTLQQPTHPHGF